VSTIAWIIATGTAVFVADRGLLWVESRGWINYRRTGLNRGAATYHLLHLSSIFNPGMEEVIEVKYGQEQQEDESGDPPGPDPKNPGQPDGPAADDGRPDREARPSR
jgi:hypothetical protein